MLELSDDERWEIQRGELTQKGKAAIRKAPEAKTGFRCTDPAGVVRTLSSSTRTPSHAVAILPALDDPLRALPGYGERWQLMGWCDDQDAARRLHDCLAKPGRYPSIEILEVEKC